MYVAYDTNYIRSEGFCGSEDMEHAPVYAVRVGIVEFPRVSAVLHMHFQFPLGCWTALVFF